MNPEARRLASESNRLPVLAAQIRDDLKLVRQSAFAMAERMLSIGKALIEAKASVAHGEWNAWLEDNVAMSARSARRYMQLVKAEVKTATVADLGLRGVLEPARTKADGKKLEQFVNYFVRHASESELARIIDQAEAVMIDGSWPDSLALEVLDRLWAEALPEARRRFLETIRKSDQEPERGGAA